MVAGCLRGEGRFVDGRHVDAAPCCHGPNHQPDGQDGQCGEAIQASEASPGMSSSNANVCSSRHRGVRLPFVRLRTLVPVVAVVADAPDDQIPGLFELPGCLRDSRPLRLDGLDLEQVAQLVALLSDRLGHNWRTRSGRRKPGDGFAADRVRGWLSGLVEDDVGRLIRAG